MRPGRGAEQAAGGRDRRVNLCPVCAASAAWVISGVVSTGGVSAFAVKIFRSKKDDSSPRRKDETGQIFHTYSTYGRGGEQFLGIYGFFDVMPKGRNENGPYHSLTDWARPRNPSFRFS